MHRMLSYHPQLFHSLQACLLKSCRHSLVHMCRVSFTLTLNCGLEGMQKEATGADQKIRAVSAVLILVNMKMGSKCQDLMITLCTKVFISMSHGPLKMN
jgi:hypothetical protein